MKRQLSILVFVLMLAAPAFAQNQNPLQPIYDEEAKKLTWTDLSIEFRPVSAEPSKDAKAFAVKSTDQENGKTFYAVSKEILGIKDISNIDVSYNPNDGGRLRLLIKFNKEGKQALTDYTTAHVGEMMGVIIDGELRLVASIRKPLSNGKVQVVGFLPAEAVGIAQRYYKPKIELARKIESSHAQPNP